MPALDSPRLLVSVRNGAEAEAALAGGCDVLDVKEPSRGAMGMAAPMTIADVLARVRDLKSSVPVSVALGEVADWERTGDYQPVADPVAYLKLGTAGLAGNAAWAQRYAAVRRRLVPDWRGPTFDVKCRIAKWIAVGYADWETADGPCPEDVLEGACECGCAGVLIDTFSKTNGGLLDWLSSRRLESLAALARRHSLEFGLAGRLQIDHLPRLETVRADILGIRSAACRAGIRTGEIDATAVRSFHEALQAAWQCATPTNRAVHASGDSLARGR
jgi:uncharacterized protein (UPF0264 family)